MALGQLRLCGDGVYRTMLEDAIACLQTFEPKEGYYVAFSGGKDSQCVYHLCKMAGVKFDAHFTLTSVDPPEVVQFIKRYYPDVQFEIPRDSDGKRITMWNLIPKKKMPPTRIVRYCCQELKEVQGKGRRVITGVRKAESVNRKKNQGNISFYTPGKKAIKQLDEIGAEYKLNQMGGVLMNYDNADTKQIIETCLLKHRMTINPIIDWEDEDVWEFLNSNNIPHCCLYDEGQERIGCIGCPMGRSKGMQEDFKRWPAYRKLYERAFEKMIKERAGNGREEWQTAEDVLNWWLQES